MACLLPNAACLHIPPLAFPPSLPPVTGESIFQDALLAGFMRGFFKLIEQYNTQDEPAFCALASVAMVLNALSIDPRYGHCQMGDACGSGARRICPRLRMKNDVPAGMEKW